MKSAIKTAAYRVVSRLGIPLIQKKFFRDSITIVMYHGVVRSPLDFYDWSFIDEGMFRRQMKYLKKHFDVIRLSDVHARMRSRTEGKPAAVITFDDGYQNNHDVAFPVLLEEGLPATVFLTTGFVDTDDTIWPFRLHHALAKTSKKVIEWDGQEFRITEQTDKVVALRAIKEKLKQMPYGGMVSAIREIVLALEGDPLEALDADSPYRMLERKSIKTMADSGLIDFGAHSHSHPILSNMTLSEQEREIKESVNAVSELTASTCRLFAYPNGERKDYTSDTIRILHESGITTAVSTTSGYNDKNTPLMELRRYGIEAEISMANFKLLVHHVIHGVKNI